MRLRSRLVRLSPLVALAAGFSTLLALGADQDPQGPRRAATEPVPVLAMRQQLGPEPLVPSLHVSPAAFATPRAIAGEGDLATAIDSCVTIDMAANDTPGAAVAVALDGVQIYQKGYGIKHRTRGGAVTPNTQFRIGSITKMMTAAAVMRQVEAGRLNLDDPVTSLVPEFAVAPPFAAHDITVRHLLTHSSGFPDVPFDLRGPTHATALAEWAGSLHDVLPHAPPGEFWNYANPNFMLAGLVGERAAGVGYHQLMALDVWGPAGMTTTTLLPAEVMARGDWSYGHSPTGPGGTEIIYDPDDYDNWIAAPAGFAFSTASDLVRWALLLGDGGGAVLTPESAAEMQHPQITLDYRPDMYYGLGIFVEDYRGLAVLQHGGNIPGWGSMLLWVPERRFAVAVLANTFASLGNAPYCIADALLQPGGDWPPDDTTDAAEWGRYIGEYEMRDALGNELQAAVGWQNHAFLITFTDRARPHWLYATRLVQVLHDTFFIDHNGDGTLDMDFTFVRSAAVPAPTRWLRNRSLVGERALTARTGLSGRAP